jgi:hypothetical protein
MSLAVDSILLSNKTIALYATVFVEVGIKPTYVIFLMWITAYYRPYTTSCISCTFYTAMHWF